MSPVCTAYLRNLPVDTLKIDRSFLAATGTGNQDDAIVRAIIAMGQTLGLTVLMEGVETEEQLAFLREAGCHQAQGFLLARPQPVDQIQRHRCVALERNITSAPVLRTQAAVRKEATSETT